MTSTSDEELINMGTKYFYYKWTRGSQDNSVSGQMDTADIADLKQQIANLKDQHTLAEIQEETYNEMYLNSKKNPSTFGLFSRLGLRNTQDWVLAYFFVSFIIFSVFMILLAARTAVNKTLTILMTLGAMISLGTMAAVTILAMG